MVSSYGKRKRYSSNQAPIQALKKRSAVKKEEKEEKLFQDYKSLGFQKMEALTPEERTAALMK